MTWTHDALMNDLASHLRSDQRMVWCDMQLGPSGSPRPDVFTLQKSYSKPQPTAYEIKVSRSDLRSDTTSGKWQSYLKYAGSVTFAVPDGLCTVADIPDGCGLIVRKDQAWRYARRPTLQRVSLPMDACMKLLIDGVSRVSRSQQPVPRSASLWIENKAVRKKFGEAVARAARDLASVERDVLTHKETATRLFEQAQQQVAAHKTYLIEQAKRDAAEFEAAKRDLCEWLGLSADASAFSVRRAIDGLKRRCDADARVEHAEANLIRARRSIEAAASALAPSTEEQAA